MFANKLKSLRISKDMTQVKLAEKLGVKKQSISNWENGNIMPSVEMLEKIADFFSVSTDYLLDRAARPVDCTRQLDVTGLGEKQIEHLLLLIGDLRKHRE